MSDTDSGIVRKIDKILGYHKIFSNIQKLVIFSVSIVLFSWISGLFTVSAALVCGIICTVISCHLLVSLDKNYSGLRFLLMFYKSHIHEFVTAVKYFRILKNYSVDLVWGSDNETNKPIDRKADENEVNAHNRAKESRTKTIESGMESENASEKFELGCLTDEINNISRLIIQDFVSPWYCVREQKDDLLDETEEILRQALKELFTQISQVDVHDLVNEVLICYHNHLCTYQIARAMYKTQPRRRKSLRGSPAKVGHLAVRQISSIEEAYEIKFSYHTAIWGAENEQNYVKSVTQLLLTRLLGTQVESCKTARTLLVEILSCNVLMPLVELLSNSDFLHESMVRVLSDETPIEVPFDSDDEREEEVLGSIVDEHSKLHVHSEALTLSSDGDRSMEASTDKSKSDLDTDSCFETNSNLSKSVSAGHISSQFVNCVGTNDKSDGTVFHDSLGDTSAILQCDRQTSLEPTFDEVPATLLMPATKIDTKFQNSYEENCVQNQVECESSQKYLDADYRPVMENLQKAATTLSQNLYREQSKLSISC